MKNNWSDVVHSGNNTTVVAYLILLHCESDRVKLKPEFLQLTLVEAQQKAVHKTFAPSVFFIKTLPSDSIDMP